MENLIKGIMTNKGIAKYDFNTLAGNLAIPACPSFPIWLCDSSTDDYHSPMGQYSSTCSLSSDEFLATFWDCHIKKYDDGYTVTKRILGRDQSNSYDIFEYTFTPKKYSRTVMLSSGMHPPELSAEFGLAYFIKYVMEKQTADFRWLHDNVRFKIIPLIQPWGFNQDILSYENVNDVNINKNWDVDGVWTADLVFGGAGSNGTAPYSEAETNVLVRWINENAYKVDLWIDCHTDSSGYSATRNRLHYIMGCSNTSLLNKVKETQERITQAYSKAGFFEQGTIGTTPSAGSASATAYTAKQMYSQKYCGIPSFMIEQYPGNPLWGGNPSINNSSADINNYVTMIRAYILAWLERDEIVTPSDDIFWYLYQWFMDNHYSKTNVESITTEYETYTVAYVSNGHGEQPTDLTNVSALPSELPVLVDTSGKYAFRGWYMDKQFIEKAYPGQMLLSDVVLYAKWIDEDEGPIEWFIGGIDTSTGNNNGMSNRAQTDLIKVQANGVITVTNMSEYAIVDVAVHKADSSYISLTSKYTLTKSENNNTWTITLNSFSTNYPTGKYIRFSVKRTDGANISTSEFDDTIITRT